MQFGTPNPTRPHDEIVRDLHPIGRIRPNVDQILFDHAARLLGLPA
jgi:hypothetical protein